MNRSRADARAEWAAFDRRGAAALHRAAANAPLRTLLATTSRVGNGLLWYAAIAVLPFVGAWPVALQMLALGTVNVLIYRHVKHRIGRARPYVDCPDINACIAPLDAFSFPSGHTLHAVSFGIVLAHAYPALTLPLLAFALLVAASRIVLGLHYPSDVLAGAATGAATAGLMLLLFG